MTLRFIQHLSGIMFPVLMLACSGSAPMDTTDSTGEAAMDANGNPSAALPRDPNNSTDTGADATDAPGATGTAEEEPGDVVSAAAPAACGSSDDCPAGVECVIAGGEQIGYCDVAETAVGELPVSGDVAVGGALLPICESDADCGDIGTCVNGGCVAIDPDNPGVIDVAADGDGSVVSLGAPAMCLLDSDCPPGIACVSLGESGPGYCNVDETVAK